MEREAVMSDLPDKGSRDGNSIKRLLKGRNSMMFVLVIATFLLLLYSSVIYVATTSRVVEDQSTGFAVNGLISALSATSPAASAAYDAGLDDTEVIELLEQPVSSDGVSQAFAHFIFDDIKRDITSSDIVSEPLASEIGLAYRSGEFSSQQSTLIGSSADIGIISTSDATWLVAIGPAVNGGKRLGLANDISAVVTGARSDQYTMIGSLALAYLVFLGLLIIVFRLITKPLKTLTQAARQYSEGNFSHRVKVPSSVSELALLAKTFNNMGEELKNQRDSVEAYSSELEAVNRKASEAVDKLSARHREQKAMIESSLEANRLNRPEEVLSLTLNKLREEIDLEDIAFFIKSEQGDFEQNNRPGVPFPDARFVDSEELDAVEKCHESRVAVKLAPAEIKDGEGSMPDGERLFIPVSTSSTEHGVIELVAREGDSFDRETERFISHFVSYMDVIIRNKALYIETIRRSHELERINKISRAISSKLDVDPLFRDVVEHTENTIHAECVFIGLIRNGRLEIRHITPGVAHVDSWVIDPNENELFNDLIKDGRAFLVNELDTDHRIEGGGFVELNNFSSLVGAPIIRNGEVLGLICGFSHNQNAFSSNDKYFLDLLASQVAIALDNARMIEEIIARDRRRDHQLSMAQKLQEDRVPKYFKQNVAAFNCRLQPADELAGDFCDVFTLGRNSVAVVAGDVANKGVAASLMTFSLLSMFRNVAKTLKPPCEILESINRSLISQIKEDGWFATAFYGKLNTSNGTFTYASAGHEQPIWYHAETGEVELLEAAGYPLGLFKSFPYETQEIELGEGDRIILYTDGITDAVDTDGRRFGHQNLLKLIADNSHLSGDNFTDTIIDAVMEFTNGKKQRDDIILAVLELQDDPWVNRSITFNESGELISDILEALTPYELDMQATYAIRLALDEALANAWRHGLKQDDGRTFDVSYLISDDGFSLRVKDSGAGFDHESLPDPTVEENLFKSSGRGVFLIRQMMDDVEYNELGNEMTVHKKFSLAEDVDENSYDGLLINNRIEIMDHCDSLEKARKAGSDAEVSPGDNAVPQKPTTNAEQGTTQA